MEKMSVRVNVRMSKIMRTPIKVGVRTYVRQLSKPVGIAKRVGGGLISFFSYSSRIMTAGFHSKQVNAIFLDSTKLKIVW